MCDIKAVLEISGILLNGEETSLQLKVYEALVREHVREQVRLIGTEFKKKYKRRLKNFFFVTSKRLQKFLLFCFFMAGTS